jgi:hypothetical protein
MNDAAVKHYAATLYGEYFGDGYTYVGCYDQGGKAGEDGYIGAGIKFETKVVAPPPTPTAYPMSIDVDGKQVVLIDRVSISYEEVLQMTGLKASQIDYIVYEGSAVSGTQFLDAGYVINLAGETRIFVFTEKTTSEDNTGSNNSGSNNTTTGATKYGFNSGKVTLRVYLGETIHKDYDIKSGLAADGKVNMNEIWEFVKARYNAVDTDTGIKCYGIYVTAGQNFMTDYLYGSEYDEVSGLYDATQKGDVALKIVLNNAKAASSGTADSSNPKTGDTIMMPVAVMTVSACALAVAFYLNKKRAF